MKFHGQLHIRETLTRETKGQTAHVSLKVKLGRRVRNMMSINFPRTFV